jgi:hypothetical protein
MEERAFEIMKAFNGRPSPVIENARSVDQDITLIMDLFTRGEVLCNNVPTRISLIPGRCDDLMARFHILMETISVLRFISNESPHSATRKTYCKAVEIVKDLPRPSVHS